MKSQIHHHPEYFTGHIRAIHGLWTNVPCLIRRLSTDAPAPVVDDVPTQAVSQSETITQPQAQRLPT